MLEFSVWIIACNEKVNLSWCRTKSKRTGSECVVAITKNVMQCLSSRTTLTNWSALIFGTNLISSICRTTNQRHQPTNSFSSAQKPTLVTFIYLLNCIRFLSHSTICWFSVSFISCWKPAIKPNTQFVSIGLMVRKRKHSEKESRSSELRPFFVSAENEKKRTVNALSFHFRDVYTLIPCHIFIDSPL